MSDDEDLFGSSASDGDDTDDLVATAASKKPIAKPKAKPKRLQKKSSAKKRKRDVPGKIRTDACTTTQIISHITLD